MRKCKDCKLFKNGCGFSNVDEQLGLNGDFVACGQFVKVNDSKDCLSCFIQCRISPSSQGSEKLLEQDKQSFELSAFTN